MKNSLSVTDSYVLPHLTADHITSGDGVIELHNRQRVLRIDVEGDQQAAADLLNKLRDPADNTWKQLNSPGNEGVSEAIHLLDKYGWLNDSSRAGEELLKKDQELYNGIVQEGSAWMKEALAETGKEKELQSRLIFFFDDTLALINELDNGKLSRTSLAELNTLSSLEGIALQLALRSWQSTSPKALHAFAGILKAAIETFAPETAARHEPPHPVMLSGIEDVNGIRNQVWSACCLLIQSLQTHRQPQWPQFIADDMDADSGINTIIQAEVAAEALVSSFENAQLLEVIRGQQHTERCAAGVFLHQYFITIRYLESILSFLRYRMQKPLRDIGFEYLLEEIGHDVHEREACVRLGLTDAEIDNFAPLPLFEVYSEILAYFAATEPLSFCLSVMIAEGMPGQKKVITDALAEQGLDDPDLAIHTELDLNLNHSYYPRKLMCSLPWISKKERVDALRNFLFTLELSQAGWNQVARYAAKNEFAVAPKAFGVSGREVGELAE